MTNSLSNYKLSSLFCGQNSISIFAGGIRPTELLKGKIQPQSGSIGLRKGLVIIQFVLALLLIVGAFVIKEQVQFIQDENLSISKDNLIDALTSE